MTGRDPHPLEFEGPIVVAVLQQSLAVINAVVTLAAAHARLRELVDNPRTPEELREACRNAADVLSHLDWVRVLEASSEIGSAAGDWFEGIGGRFERGAFPTSGGDCKLTE